jgi:hypothetical protein
MCNLALVWGMSRIGRTVMKQNIHIGIAAGAFLAFAAACPLAGAAIIYNNLGNTNNGFRIQNSTSWAAERFNSDATDLILTSATLSLAPSTAGNFKLSLYTDIAGVPGTSVGTLFSGSTTSGIGGGGNVAFSNLTQPLLPNTNYWIVTSVAIGDPTAFGWGVTSTPTGTGSGFQATSATSTNQGGTWSTSPGTPQQLQLVANTPEPTGLALLGLGSLGLLARGRRHT